MSYCITLIQEVTIPPFSVEIHVQELSRNPVAFRAKEKRLVQVLKDLDSRLERLNKDRDAALKK